MQLYVDKGCAHHIWATNTPWETLKLNNIRISIEIVIIVRIDDFKQMFVLQYQQ